jgi:lipopolysaccharide transport system permease protein
LPSEGVPYPVFALAALLPWQLFSAAVAGSSNSLVGSSNLLTKVYFPRLIIPIAAVVSTLADFAVSSVLLAGLMLWYGIVPGIGVLLLPLLVVQALVLALAIGLWTSALNVQYRDVQFALPFALQALLFASPVAYSAALVPDGPWRIVYGLNPLVGVIQGFRWALLGAAPPGPLVWLSAIVTLALLVGGLFFFKRMEDTFADVV